MNAVIASQASSLVRNANVLVATNHSNVLVASGNRPAPVEVPHVQSRPPVTIEMQRPVRMRHQSLTEATAVQTYATNAQSIRDCSFHGLDLYA